MTGWLRALPSGARSRVFGAAPVVSWSTLRRMPEYGLKNATQFELPSGLMLLKGVRESGVAAESDYLAGAVDAGLLYVVDPDAEPPDPVQPLDPLYVRRGDSTPDHVYANEGGGVLTEVLLSSQLPVVPNTLVTIGDSFLVTTLAYDDTAKAWQHLNSAMLTSGRILLGQRFKLLHDGGIAGQTTAQMLTRFTADVLSYSPGYVFIGGGTNDVDQGVSAATIEANLTAMFDAAENAGIRVITATIPPRDANTNAKNAVLFTVNRWLREQAAARGLILVDLFSVLADAATADYVTSPQLSLDGIHPYTTAGGWRMGRAFYEACKDVVPVASVLPASNLDTASLIANGMFVGTGGVKGTGVTGSVADSWTVEPIPGQTTTAVASKVARTDRGPGALQQVAVSAGQAQIRARNTNVGTDWSVGDEIFGTIAFETDSDWSTVTFFDCYVVCYSSGFVKLLRGVDNGLMSYPFEDGNRPAAGVFRTPSIVIPSGTTSIQLGVEIIGTGTFRFKQAELVKGHNL